MQASTIVSIKFIIQQESESEMKQVAYLVLIYLIQYGLADKEKDVLSLKETIPDGRIVGGWETAIYYFPYLVSLQSNGRHICGAAIINSTTIITAAHCVLEYSKPEQYAIRAGSTEHANGGMYIRVRRIIPHEYFNVPTSLNNDIALIALDSPLTFSRFIQPIPIVGHTDFIQPKAVLYISGWGTAATNLKMTEARLRYTNIVQMDHDYCRRIYVGAGVVTNTMFCAGSQYGGRDSCQGDSGGPLATLVDGRMRLFGIVSWGLGCGLQDYPGIYTRVSAYGTWISTTMLRI